MLTEPTKAKAPPLLDSRPTLNQVHFVSGNASNSKFSLAALQSLFPITAQRPTAPRR